MKQAGGKVRGGIRREDGFGNLGDDLAVVDAGRDAEKGDASCFVAEGDGVLDGGNVAILGEEGGVEIVEMAAKFGDQI